MSVWRFGFYNTVGAEGEVCQDGFSLFIRDGGIYQVSFAVEFYAVPVFVGLVVRGVDVFCRIEFKFRPGKPCFPVTEVFVLGPCIDASKMVF